MMTERELELRRSKSWWDGRGKPYHLPVRKRVSGMKPIGNSRLTIKSLSDLDDLGEEYYEFVPYMDTDDAFTEPVLPGSENKTFRTENAEYVVKSVTDGIKDEPVVAADGKPTHCSNAFGDSDGDTELRKTKTPPPTSSGDKSGLNKLSMVNEKNIDKMTSDNKEVDNDHQLGNTQMTRGVCKSKSTSTVGEGRVKKTGVQLRRCLSLYDRKRNPHFCKDHLRTSNEDDKSMRDFGFITNRNILKKDKIMPVTDGRNTSRSTHNKIDRTPVKRRNTMPDKVNTAHAMSAERYSPNCHQKRKSPETWKPLRDVNYSSMGSEKSNGTSRSRVSSTISIGSDGSSELDFDSLVPVRLSSRISGSKSPRQSLIPRPVRPRSTTLCLGDASVNDYLSNGLKTFRPGNNLKRSISWYEKRVSSSSNGTEVCIKIRESVASISSSESSAFSSTDDVFSTKPKSTEIKTIQTVSHHANMSISDPLEPGVPAFTGVYIVFLCFFSKTRL